MELQKTVALEEQKTLDATPKKLKITNLKKRFFPKLKFAVNDVTFSVPHRVNFGLIGPNGAGKSTIFNIILSKIVKTSGNVWLDKTPNYHAFSPICNAGTPYNYNKFAIVFQEDSLWEELKVRDNLEFYARLHNVDREALAELLIYFEFDHYLDKPAGDLSSGNKRKLCILISLMGNPDFLLFDEATCGVDINMRLRMRNIVAFYKEKNNAASVFTTHFLKDIEIFCDKIGIIDQGEFLCIDDLSSLKRTLGGYLTTLRFGVNGRVNEVMGQLALKAKVKVVNEDQDDRTVKSILSGVEDVFGLLYYLMELKNERILEDFSLNQLSIEDIYLDVFNRSE
jgi:ABC-2 type transport system ATP-binding protein